MIHLLTQSAQLYTDQYQRDDWGEEVATRAATGPPIPCLVRPMSSEMMNRQGRDGSKRFARLYFAQAPFNEADSRKITIVVQGRTWRPDGAQDVMSQGRVWQVDCELVD